MVIDPVTGIASVMVAATVPLLAFGSISVPERSLMRSEARISAAAGTQAAIDAINPLTGELLKSEELHDSIKASMARIDGILDKIEDDALVLLDAQFHVEGLFAAGKHVLSQARMAMNADEARSMVAGWLQFGAA